MLEAWSESSTRFDHVERHVPDLVLEIDLCPAFQEVAVALVVCENHRVLAWIHAHVFTQGVFLLVGPSFAGLALVSIPARLEPLVLLSKLTLSLVV